METKNRHTFAIAAYKENKYLETAVKSVVNQTIESDRYIVTGTPNGFIDAISKKYSVPVLVNNAENAQTSLGNFRFALENSKTELTTIVHQDDYYAPRYAEEVLKKAQGKKPIILFTDYFEIRNGQKVYKNKLLKVKRMMNTGIKVFPNSKFVRKRVLAFGCSICCPSVTYSKEALDYFEKENGYASGCGDWALWLRLAELNGDFLYINKPLIGHRIHEGSDTSRSIGDDSRGQDELRILKTLWPKPIAELIYKKYHKAIYSNDIRINKKT